MGAWHCPLLHVPVPVTLQCMWCALISDIAAVRRMLGGSDGNTECHRRRSQGKVHGCIEGIGARAWGVDIALHAPVADVREACKREEEHPRVC